MCMDREHRYRMEVTTHYDKFELVVNAKGIAEAVAKADGYVVKRYGPSSMFRVNIHRMGYDTEESAIEHGAIY